jgi:serine/threonine protein phosphatase PrpC
MIVDHGDPGMARLATAVCVSPSRGRGDDRAAVFARDRRVVVALADGAGGSGGGARAAAATIDAIARAEPGVTWTDALARLDRSLPHVGPGLTTAIVVELAAEGVRGASVGDSVAWIVSDTIVELTAHQHAKPLLGDGAVPVAFSHPPLAPDDTLLVASDGLWRYASRPAIIAAVGDTDLDAVAAMLVELVRLPRGGLPDDVSVVLCRRVAPAR